MHSTTDTCPSCNNCQHSPLPPTPRNKSGSALSSFPASSLSRLLFIYLFICPLILRLPTNCQSRPYKTQFCRGRLGLNSSSRLATLLVAFMFPCAHHMDCNLSCRGGGTRETGASTDATHAVDERTAPHRLGRTCTVIF